MKKFNFILVMTVILLAALFVVSNICFEDSGSGTRPYRVEINRLSKAIEQGKEPDVSACSYVKAVTKFESQPDFYKQNSDFIIQSINGQLYRFDYNSSDSSDSTSRNVMNISLGIASAVMIAILLYVRLKLLKPFNKLSKVPYELSKGNLSTPIEETKNRYFGKFVWGVNMLRENIIDQKQNELELLKEKQTLVLSISHDIRTPLAAIKLYANGLSKGIYKDSEKIMDAAAHINSNADDIDSFVTQLTHSASDDLIKLDVKESEFYLSSIVDVIKTNYTARLADSATEFTVMDYRDCILKGDSERSVEVLQNLLENAIKYGDGKYIRISFSEEDGCRLIIVRNSGCTLPSNEVIHIFDSFWRGSNASGKSGSGLGLYICRQLMMKMDGEITAHTDDGDMCITVVFRKA